MSTDRELRELAHRADVKDRVGKLKGRALDFFLRDTLIASWNPLIYDGDALQIAVKLELDIIFYRKHLDTL